MVSDMNTNEPAEEKEPYKVFYQDKRPDGVNFFPEKIDNSP